MTVTATEVIALHFEYNDTIIDINNNNVYEIIITRLNINECIIHITSRKLMRLRVMSTR